MLICLKCDQLTEPAAFRAQGHAVIAVCGQCGGEVKIGELSSPHFEPFAPPPSYCPKCIAPLGGGAMTCPHCGIDARRADPGAHRPPAMLAAAWKNLIAEWQRPDLHAELIRMAEQAGLLGELGRLYLIYLAQRPHDRLADQGLEEVSRLAAVAEAADLELTITVTPSITPIARA